MHFTDAAFVLSARRHGESAAVARVLTRTHGLVAGVVRGVASKSQRGLWQAGNSVLITWSARLAEHLGSMHGELLAATAAPLMQRAEALSALTAACALVERCVPERDPHPALFDAFAALMHSGAALEAYCRFELVLLTECGFQLDLSCCAATGEVTDLAYVSPKSGRAVGRVAGEPYKEKLLPLPEFLLSSSRTPSPHALDTPSPHALDTPSPHALDTPSPHALDTPSLTLPPSGRGDDMGISDTLSPPPARGRVREGEKREIVANARVLRQNMTEAEKILWYHLRAHRFDGCSFRRQHPIGGRYIADFVCAYKQLIIELDGGQHAEQMVYDTERTTFLESEGYRVLRFWNHDVMTNLEGVLLTIKHALDTPSLTLPPSGRGDNMSALHEEYLDSLRLTGYFLERWVLAPHGWTMPAARNRLLETMYEKQIG